jgi:hypothetical protein
MMEELKPKTLCDKIITYWNLSDEVSDPQYDIEPVQDDDERIENDTADRIVRPKREIQCDTYELEEQMDHCLELCFLCYAVFDAINTSPEMKSPNFTSDEFKIERANPPAQIYVKSDWTTAYTKIFSFFMECVHRFHGQKYLHFLFGVVEIARGTRLQKMYFLVPRAIRILKNQSLIKDWQENCLVLVDRSSPEAKIDDFCDRVLSEYITFVRHQYSLLQKPWPFNKAGEVIAFCISLTVVTTLCINMFLCMVFVGSYSHHSLGNTTLHYAKHWYVHLLTVMAAIHFFFSVVWLTFYILAYSGWIMDTQLDAYREKNPRMISWLNMAWFRYLKKLQFFISDGNLQYALSLLIFSFCGLHVNFLFNAINMIDFCKRFRNLAKVIEALLLTYSALAGTVVFGFCVQYVFVAVGFMIFEKGYAFADMDTSDCSTLLECLLGHWDYGFRSAPVWHGAHLTWSEFFFDYMYNLVVILIMAAIISGIIIDTFADLRTKMQEIMQDMQTKCFICSLDKSSLERRSVKFNTHILFEHFMWAYARFLLYLEETDESLFTGPESYVKKMIKQQNMAFFPINRCIALEATETGSEHIEREVRVKDMEDVRASTRTHIEHTTRIKQFEMECKIDLKDMRENLHASVTRLGALQHSLVQEEEQDKKKKKKK